ncbi:MAG: ferritin family protein [Sulfobacillus sp.]
MRRTTFCAGIEDLNAARKSLMEELEAMINYDDRICATANQQLAEVLAANRDDEKEHAARLLVYIMDRDPVLAEQVQLAMAVPRRKA